MTHLLQTAALLGAMAALAGYLGWALFGAEGLAWGVLTVTIAMALGSSVSPRLVLRLAGARPLAPWEMPALHRLAGALAARAGLAHMPALYYVPSRLLNAFAVDGRDHAAIALTDGLLRHLDRRELAGVLAHEVAHLRARDVRVMQLADVVGRMTSVLSLFGAMALLLLYPAAAASGMALPLAPLVVMVLAPAASAALQLALSRTREYGADQLAVELTGDPRGLALALDKLERLQGGWMERVFAPRTPRWLRSHPDTRERIRRLLSCNPPTAVWA